MANRVREDEKNERIIRGLLKLPENRRCINCNSLGPQYVCTNFWTFVCTTCSGIHREFTHRVKSVSMAKFTLQEVTALQEGGNKRARDIYFKEWDSQHQTAPDSSNVERLRDFIKHAYVDRRFSGEKNYGKPPSVKSGDKEEFNENRRYDSYQRGSRSPSYDDTYERRYSEGSSPGGRNDDKGYRNNYDERRSPGYDQESRQYNDYRRSPGRPEIINDWRRENRFGNGGKVEDNRVSDGDSKLEGRSPERLKEPGATSPPIVRPVREILGDNVMPLRIIEPPKANVSRTTVGSAQTQRTTSSSSLGSNNGNPVEVKVENSRSLIDFDAEPEPLVTAAVQQVQQTTVPQSTAQPSSTSNDSNWASFDFAPEVKVSQAPSNANPIDSVISQLTAPPSVPGQLSGIANSSGAPVVASAGNTAIFPMTGSSPVALVGNSSALPFNVGAPATALVGGLSTFNPSGVSVAAPGLAPTMPVHTGNSFGKVTEAGQWLNVQHQQSSLFSASSGQPTAQQFAPPFGGASGNQTHNFSPAPNMQVAFGTSGGAPSVVPNTPPVGSAGVTQPSVVETKPIGRKELPADLFTATYSSFPVVHPGWQTGPVRGMGFPVQYNNAVLPMQTFVQPAKSTNPFDLSETAAVQNQTFPSMASLQGALPNLPLSSGIQHAPSPAWIPSQSLPYQSAVLPSQQQQQQQQPTYALAVPPRAYMTQAPGGMPLPGHQGIGTFGSEGPGFSAVNMDQQMVSRFSAPATPQPFPSVGGNPFG